MRGDGRRGGEIEEEEKKKLKRKNKMWKRDEKRTWNEALSAPQPQPQFTITLEYLEFRLRSHFMNQEYEITLSSPCQPSWKGMRGEFSSLNYSPPFQRLAVPKRA
ncbi:hypothetical protein M8J76_012855 [Diaphorina citri]|nr:hypothetical protein M8J77_024649 [Diaphorina citri]KAI5741362.1 hypothetical protein M8J76_012855 [Diaphorina citri]